MRARIACQHAQGKRILMFRKSKPVEMPKDMDINVAVAYEPPSKTVVITKGGGYYHIDTSMDELLDYLQEYKDLGLLKPDVFIVLDVVGQYDTKRVSVKYKHILEIRSTEC